MEESKFDPKLIDQAVEYILADSNIQKVLEKIILPMKDTLIENKRFVYNRYGNKLRSISTLSDDDLKETILEFLKFEYNRHWVGLQRQTKNILSDIKKLRQILEIIADENIDIETKIKNTKEIKGMGKAIFTAILHVVFPNKYGVYNQRTYSALEKLNIASLLNLKGNIEEYPIVNSLLVKLLNKINNKMNLDLDLWELDTIWPYYLNYVSSDSELQIEKEENFIQKEIHMSEMIISNWDKIEGLKDLILLEKEGEPLVEFPIEGGRIDILAEDKADNSLVIIELKVNLRPKDIGQLLNYICKMEKHNLAKKYNKVKGIFIYQNKEKDIDQLITWLMSKNVPIYKKKYRNVVEILDD